MGEHLRLEPELIAQLLHSALLKIGMQVVWEGIETQRWRDGDLLRLQEVLGEVDLLDSLQRAFNGERLFLISEFGQAPAVRPLLAPGDEHRLTTGGLLFPTGWYLRNLVNSDRHYLELAVYSVDPKRHLAFPRRHDAALQAQEEARSGPYNFLSQISTPALAGQVRKFIRLQSQVDQAQIACALERHRLARKAYPPTLVDLVPEFLPKAPRDLFSGELLRYEPRGQRRYGLWSVGWDLKDDGGQVGMTDGKPDPMKGDWVWPEMVAAPVPKGAASR
jgi:hypothetical protein